jgi:hypothetical protein
VDFASILAAVKTGSSAVSAGYQGWSWWRKWRRGTVAITHPSNRDNVPRPTFGVEGTSKKPRGRYWLVTPGKDEALWLKTRITFRPDGRWREEVHIGDHPGPREVLLVLAWTSDLMDAFFQNYKDRSCRLNDHGTPLKLSIPLATDHFQVVQAMVLQIPA